MVTSSKFYNRVAKITEPQLNEENVKAAIRLYAKYRAANGFKEAYSKLLTHPDDNFKLSKGEIANFGLSLAPARVSGVINTCKWSTKGCRDLCINTAGNGLYPATQNGRIVKTKFFVDHPKEFLTILKYELDNLRSKMRNLDIDFAVRLNVFSDIPWETITPWLFRYFSDVQFYDYTKYKDRTNLPKNYHLTFSASERDSDDQLAKMLKRKQNITIVADLIDGKVPTTWHGFRVIDGDENDYRPADPSGVVVFLKPKGKAKSKTKVPRGYFVRTQNGFNSKQIMENSMRHFTTPNSSMISEVRWLPNEDDKTVGVMYIKFHNNTVYRYNNVSLSRVVAFSKAASPGQYFDQRVRPTYPSTKMPNGFPKKVALSANA